MADPRRLAELSMPTELAKEVAHQIDAGASGGAGVFSSLESDGPTTLKGKVDIISGSNTTPLVHVAQWVTGSNHKSTGATVNDLNSYYAIFGGLEYYSTSNTGYQMVGMGYNTIYSGGATPIMPMVAFGAKQTSNVGDDLGSFLLAMRQTTSSSNIAEVLEFKLNGEIVGLLATDVPVTTDKSFTSKKYVDSATRTKAQTVALVALTDSTTGTVGNTLAAIPAATAATTDTSAASLASVNASLGVLRNEVASLSAKINAIIAALKA